jgi:hypothetical protein
MTTEHLVSWIVVPAELTKYGYFCHISLPADHTGCRVPLIALMADIHITITQIHTHTHVVTEKFIKLCARLTHTHTHTHKPVHFRNFEDNKPCRNTAFPFYRVIDVPCKEIDLRNMCLILQSYHISSRDSALITQESSVPHCCHLSNGGKTLGGRFLIQ